MAAISDRELRLPFELTKPDPPCFICRQCHIVVLNLLQYCDCGNAFYCSPTCKDLDAPYHKKVCEPHHRSHRAAYVLQAISEQNLVKEFCLHYLSMGSGVTEAIIMFKKGKGSISRFGLSTNHRYISVDQQSLLVSEQMELTHLLRTSSEKGIVVGFQEEGDGENGALLTTHFYVIGTFFQGHNSFLHYLESNAQTFLKHYSTTSSPKYKAPVSFVTLDEGISFAPVCVRCHKVCLATLEHCICRTVTFCSKTCQKEHFPLHKFFCRPAEHSYSSLHASLLTYLSTRWIPNNRIAEKSIENILLSGSNDNKPHQAVFTDMATYDLGPSQIGLSPGEKGISIFQFSDPNKGEIPELRPCLQHIVPESVEKFKAMELVLSTLMVQVPSNVGIHILIYIVNRDEYHFFTMGLVKKKKNCFSNAIRKAFKLHEYFPKVIPDKNIPLERKEDALKRT